MEYRKGIVFGLIVLLLGCGHSFKEMIPHSAYRWRRAVCVQPSYNKIELVPDIPKCGSLVSDNTMTIHGCEIAGYITVSAKTLPENRYRVLTHEMGHTYTSRHVPSFKGIMTANSNEALPYITQADIDIVCKDIACLCQRPEKP